MNELVYPLVWTINNTTYSFLGLTSDGQRKEFFLPFRRNRYDRHEWGMFNWFNGYFNEKDEFVITSIVEKDPPPIKSQKIINFGNTFMEIEGLPRYAADSIAELEDLILIDLEKHQIDRLDIPVLLTPFSNKLSKYFVQYHKEPFTQDQIVTYCNALSCMPSEFCNTRCIRPICHKLKIDVHQDYIQTNFERKLPTPGEYRDVIAYNVSDIYIDELSKSDEERYRILADVLKVLHIRQRYTVLAHITLPISVILNVKQRIQEFNPIMIRCFEIEVLEPIDDPCVKLYEKYDYIIQVDRHRRISLYNDKVKSVGFKTKFAYIHTLLEIIIKNWYLGNKELPPIPDNFTIDEIVKDRKLFGHVPDCLRELYIEHNLPFDKNIPCIRIKNGDDHCFWPVEFYNGCDPSSNQTIDNEYYHNAIERLYQCLRQIDF